MSKHTPGPYRVTKKFEVGPVSQSDDQSNGMVIPLADVYGDNRQANADLFAAAPALLEALEFIMSQQPYSATQGWRDNVKKGREMALAAIAKATGAS